MPDNADGGCRAGDGSSPSSLGQGHISSPESGPAPGIAQPAVQWNSASIAALAPSDKSAAPQCSPALIAALTQATSQQPRSLVPPQ